VHQTYDDSIFAGQTDGTRPSPSPYASDTRRQRGSAGSTELHLIIDEPTFIIVDVQ